MRVLTGSGSGGPAGPGCPPDDGRASAAEGCAERRGVRARSRGDRGRCLRGSRHPRGATRPRRRDPRRLGELGSFDRVRGPGPASRGLARRGDGIGGGLDPADQRRRSDLHPLGPTDRVDLQLAGRRGAPSGHCERASVAGGRRAGTSRVAGGQSAARIGGFRTRPLVERLSATLGSGILEARPRERRRNPGRVRRGRQPRASLQRAFRAVYARGRTVRTPRRRLSRRLEEGGTI